MKKNYFFATLLMLAIAFNLQAQFVELDGKDPVFHVTFEGTYETGQLITAGTDTYGGYENYDGNIVEEGTDTIRGHAWGGGVFDDWTYLEQVVNADGFEEMFLPTMHWDSYITNPDRPQGIAAYTDTHGSYAGPRGTSPRSISCFVLFTDSARVDTANGAWGGDHMFYQLGKWDSEGGGGFIRWEINPANLKMKVDWGLAADFTAEGVIPSGEWVHVALTIPDGGARADVKLYINGVQEEFVAEEATGPEVTTINTRLTPDVNYDGIFIAKFSNVWMADYRVYDSELSQEELNTLLGIVPESVQTLSQKNLFNAYPVPNNGIFTVETAEPGLNQVVVRNTLGQVVHEQVIDQTELIDISSMPVGMYFVSVSDSKNNVQTKKILLK